MTARLEAKTALITGGGRGLGRAFAIGMAREGADIAILDIARNIPGRRTNLADPDDLRASAKAVTDMGRRCLAFQADTRSSADLEAAVKGTLETYGHIDVLVANAGIGAPFQPFTEVEEEEWDRVLDINLKGAFLSAKAVAPHMIARKSGRIIFISSQAGLKGYAGISSYCAAKFGVIGLMKCLAIELAAHGINVNAVCPGSVDTEGNRLVAEEMGVTFEQMVGEFTSRQLISRVMPPERIADAVIYLASQSGDFITGHALAIDGGATTNASSLPPLVAAALTASLFRRPLHCATLPFTTRRSEAPSNVPARCSH